MQSLRGRAELQASDAGLRLESGLCESLAAKLAGNSPPAEARLSGLASALAVNASHTQIAAVGIRCSLRVQSTATKLTAAAGRYTENDASSAAQFQSVTASTVS
jgi:hypothetical protein